jgi:hypothetical protein
MGSNNEHEKFMEHLFIFFKTISLKIFYKEVVATASMATQSKTQTQIFHMSGHTETICDAQTVMGPVTGWVRRPKFASITFYSSDMGVPLCHMIRA